MTERYERWRADPVAKAILEAYRADNLTSKQQEAFEVLVDQTSSRLLPKRDYREAKTILVGAIGCPLAQNLIADFKAAVRDRNKWPSEGTDPHVWERCRHREGEK